jgi:hypothetical protein
LRGEQGQKVTGEDEKIRERRDASIVRPDKTKETRQDKVRRNKTNGLREEGKREEERKKGGRRLLMYKDIRHPR